MIFVLSPACPQCGAPNSVVYSCEPKCCFNHVCSACRAQFQLLTKELGSKLSPEIFAAGVPEVESCLPTTECANCESLRVYQVSLPDSSDLQTACADCYSVLELVFAEE
jgi:hypothetical protein